MAMTAEAKMRLASFAYVKTVRRNDVKTKTEDFIKILTTLMGPRKRLSG